MREYYRMCEAAKEIQEEWQPRVGDRFYLAINLYQTSSGCLVPFKNGKLLYKEGIYYLIPPQFSFLSELIFKNPNLHFVFVVPYQEYYQKKLLNEFQNERRLFHEFVNFVIPQKLLLKYGLDEAWILFYYDTVYEKIWDGEQWIKKE